MSATVSSSNSFLLTTTYRSKLRNSTNPRQLTVSGSKKTPQSSETETRTNPFQFDWGKISDVKSLIPVVKTPTALGGSGRQKDSGTVFVAGATGLAGVHIAQMLLREGYKVRAGVPDLGAAQELARFALDYKIISAEELKRLNAVESLFDDAESIAKAMGNASKVVVTIGTAENGPANKVTTSDALQVVEAAQLAGVRHMAIIYDDSAGVPTSPSSVLEGISSFFNNIFSKSKPLSVTELIEKVVQTDVKFTFIKTALTDEFAPESSYNVVVAAEGRTVENDYKVTRSRMAGLVAQLFSNTEIAEDKVVEVYTEPSAESKSVEQLFSGIPEDGRRKAYAEAAAKAEAEEAAVKAVEQAREAEKVKTQLEEVKKLSEQESRASSLAEEAKLKAEQAGASVDSLLSKAKDLSTGFSWNKLGSQLATAVKTPESGTQKVQVATVRGQAKARNLASQKAVVKPTSQNPKPKSKPAPKERTATAEKPNGKEVRNIFGGLFKQETIYVDDV